MPGPSAGAWPDIPAGEGQPPAAARRLRLLPARYAAGTYSSRVSERGTQDGAAAALADVPQIDVTRLRVAIARVSRRLRRHELAGLTPTQLSALATVDAAGPLRLGDLAAAEQIAPSTLTRLVTALEELGYVERCAVPGDARSSTLTITACGHEALERIRRETTIVLADSLRTLSADQLIALAAALPALERLSDPDPPDRRDPAGR
jgi:DNA-binding MarR family transcriptional regulator